MCLAVPGKIVSVEGDDWQRNGRIDFGGVLRTANLALVPEACVGEYVVVHAGIAISRLDEEEAQRTLEELRRLANVTDLEDR